MKVAMQQAHIEDRDYWVGKLAALLLVETPNLGNAAAVAWANDIWLRLRTTPR